MSPIANDISSTYHSICIEKLPDKTIRSILRFLGSRDVAHAALSSRRLNSIAYEAIGWNVDPLSKLQCWRSFCTYLIASQVRLLCVRHVAVPGDGTMWWNYTHHEREITDQSNTDRSSRRIMKYWAEAIPVPISQWEVFVVRLDTVLGSSRKVWLRQGQSGKWKESKQSARRAFTGNMFAEAGSWTSGWTRDLAQ